jgi:hypothetical protein
MHEYKAGAPFERIAMGIAEPAPDSDKGNRELLIVTDCITKWPEVHANSNQEALTVTNSLVTNFICLFGCQDICTMTRAGSSNLDSMKSCWSA